MDLANLSLAAVGHVLAVVGPPHLSLAAVGHVLAVVGLPHLPLPAVFQVLDIMDLNSERGLQKLWVVPAAASALFSQQRQILNNRWRKSEN